MQRLLCLALATTAWGKGDVEEQLGALSQLVSAQASRIDALEAELHRAKRAKPAPSYAAAPSYPTATPYAPQYQAQPQRPQPQSAPPKIGCCNCRKVFAVPAGSKIVACPYCGTHNRVPT